MLTLGVNMAVNISENCKYMCVKMDENMVFNMVVKMDINDKHGIKQVYTRGLLLTNNQQFR